MAIRIVTDSTCDISPLMGNEKNVDILPLKVLINGEEFRDGFDITSHEFFQKLRVAKDLPTTSQVNPEGFFEVFKKHISNGDDVVCITLAAGISGTYQSAVIAKDMLESGSERVYVVDSTQATFGSRILVEHAIKMRDDGASAKEIADKIEELKQRVVFLGIVDTLKYLKMGGRLSGAAAALGGLLNIKPIVALKDGAIDSVGKVRGQQAAFDFCLNTLKKQPLDTDYPLSIAHADAEDFFEKFILFMNDNGYNTDNAYKGEIGCVIGTHAGPGCVGIAYIEKK